MKHLRKPASILAGGVAVLLVAGLAGLGLAKDTPGEGAGTATAQFLKFLRTPRGVAMGEAHTAIANDAGAAYWNPAGLANLKQWQVSAAYFNWSLGSGASASNTGFLSGAFPVHAAKGVIGVNVGYSDPGVGNEDSTDAFGVPVAGGVKLKASDLVGGVTYARRMEMKDADLNLGGTVKTVRSVLGDTANSYRATALALDVGLQYRFGSEKRIAAGAALENLGTKMKFVSESDALPLAGRIGLGYVPFKVKDHEVKVASDLVLPSDRKLHVNLGAEYWYAGLAAARVGWSALGDVSNKAAGGGVTGLTAGVGVRYQDFQVDLAYVPKENFGNQYRVGLTYNFGAAKAQSEREARLREAERRAKAAAEQLKDISTPSK